MSSPATSLSLSLKQECSDDIAIAPPLTLSQQDRLRRNLEAMRKSNPGCAVMAWLLYLYAAKAMDLKKLRVKDLFDASLSVRKSFVLNYGMGRTERHLEMVPELEACLEDWVLTRIEKANPEAFILMSRNLGGSLSRWQINRNLHTVMDGIVDEHVSQVLALRRTGAWNFYIKHGCDLLKTANWLGQTVAQTSNVMWAHEAGAQAQLRGRSKASPQPRDNGTAEILSLFEAENLTLNRKVQELNAQVEQLSAANAGLKASLARKLNSQEPVATTPLDVPIGLLEIPEAIEQYFPGRIAFHNAALTSLRESPYEKVSEVWDLFRLLACEFYHHYTGASWDTVQTALHGRRAYFQHSSGIFASGRFDGYQRKHAGRTWTLSKHLCLGSSRDPRRCFRLFFEWDPEAKQIVVFHAGRHLDCLNS